MSRPPRPPIAASASKWLSIRASQSTMGYSIVVRDRDDIRGTSSESSIKCSYRAILQDFDKSYSICVHTLLKCASRAGIIRAVHNEDFVCPSCLRSNTG